MVGSRHRTGAAVMMRWSGKRWTAGLGAAIVALAAIASCEVQPLHASCPLDEEVVSKGICNGNVGSVSCVVKHHPQCDQSVCLSYNSNPPICTRACGVVECPVGDDCYAFATSDPLAGAVACTTDKGCAPQEACGPTGKCAPAEKYCVPNTLKASTTNK